MKLRVYIWRDANFDFWHQVDRPLEGRWGPYRMRGYAIGAARRRLRYRQAAFEFIDGPPPRDRSRDRSISR
jgi:hypothetical protein